MRGGEPVFVRYIHEPSCDRVIRVYLSGRHNLWSIRSNHIKHQGRMVAFAHQAARMAALTPHSTHQARPGGQAQGRTRRASPAHLRRGAVLYISASLRAFAHLVAVFFTSRRRRAAPSAKIAFGTIAWTPQLPRRGGLFVGVAHVRLRCEPNRLAGEEQHLQSIR